MIQRARRRAIAAHSRTHDWLRGAVALACCIATAVAVAASFPERSNAGFGTGGTRLFDSVETEVAQLWTLPGDRLLVRVAATFATPSMPRDPAGVAGLWRLNGDGTPDVAFGGGDGHVASSPLCAVPCALQRAAPSGDRIYVIEGSDELTARTVRRLHDDGALDASWGNGGTVRGLDAHAGFVPMALAPATSGALVVAGIESASLVVARIAADGSVDATFGAGGFADAGLQGVGPVPVVRALADGRVLVLQGDRLVRLDAAGRRDAVFGIGGLVDIIPMFASDLVAEPSGRMLVVGSRNDGGAEPALALVVLALRADGALDRAYGVDGVARVTTDRADDDALGIAAALDAQGRLVVVGYAGRATFSPFDSEMHRAIVARLLPDGAPDLHFAPGGATAFWSGAGSEALAVAVAADGRIVVGGTSHLTPVYAGKYPDYRPRAAVFALAGGTAARARPAHESAAFEFLHAAFGHYFVTADPDEVRKLDASSDWARTGRAFNVWPEATPGRVPVCRFWSGQRFAPKSSHFYTPYDFECRLLERGDTWALEGTPFALRLPEGVPGTRTCPADSQPLYRAYNDGAGGAPNHRYTIEASVLDEMIAGGWVTEGEATTRVFACVPLQ